MTETEIENSLQALANSGMIHLAEGQWQPQHDWIKVASKPGNATLAHYHRSSLLKAIEAQALPSATRNYRSLSFALSAEEYERLLAELNDFAGKICTSFDADQIADRRMYQLNFNLIPWTAELPQSAEALRMTAEF